MDKNSIVVGHSLGPAFLLNVLQDLKEPIKASFFVAGFTNLLGDPIFDEVNKTFVEKGFDWRMAKRNGGNFYLYHSDNDPYVPISEADKLSEKLGVASVSVKGAGHFNKKSGFDKFDLLLDDLKSELTVVG